MRNIGVIINCTIDFFVAYSLASYIEISLSNLNLNACHVL